MTRRMKLELTYALAAYALAAACVCTGNVLAGLAAANGGTLVLVRVGRR